MAEVSSNHPPEEASAPDGLSPRAAARRQAFLDAATEVFVAEGYERASMTEIVRRAGGSLATLYAQFGSKEGLMQAVIEARSSKIAAPLEDVAARHLPLQAGLELFAIRFLTAVMSRDSLGMFRIIVGEGHRFPRIAAHFRRYGPERVVAVVAAYLEERAAAGEITVTDPHVAANEFLALVRGPMHLRPIFDPGYWPDADQIAVQARRGVDIFLNGVRAR